MKSVPDDEIDVVDLSDGTIIERLRSAAEAEDVFVATRAWSLEKTRLSIRSRGDFFDREGVVVFSRDGVEALRAPVGALPLTIGRSDKADCRLDHDGVSRLHAQLERVGNLVRLRDAGSKNGTYLNGKQIEFDDLRDGDEVRFGEISFRVKRA